MKIAANRLGEMLLEAGLIDQFQLDSALSMQRNLGGRIGSSLVWQVGFGAASLNCFSA